MDWNHWSSAPHRAIFATWIGPHVGYIRNLNDGHPGQLLEWRDGAWWQKVGESWHTPPFFKPTHWRDACG